MNIKTPGVRKDAYWQSSVPYAHPPVWAAAHAEGLTLFAHVVGDDVYLQGGELYQTEYGHADNRGVYWHSYGHPTAEAFFSFEVTGPPETRQVSVATYTRTPSSYLYSSRRNTEIVTVFDGYIPSRSHPGQSHAQVEDQHYYNEVTPGMARRWTPFLFVPVKVTFNSGETYEGTLRFFHPRAGRINLDDVVRENQLTYLSTLGGAEIAGTWTVRDLRDLLPLLSSDFSIEQGTDALWAWFFDVVGAPKTIDDADNSGVKSSWTKKGNVAMLEKLAADEPVLNRYLLWLLNKRTSEKTSNNKLIKAFIEGVKGDYKKLVEGLRSTLARAPELGVYRSSNYGTDIPHRNHCLALPGADEAERARKAKDAWQFQKSMTGKAGGLGIDEKAHKTLHKLVAAGEIPLSIFHAPGNKKHIINNEFDLWEAALGKPDWKDEVIEIAKDVSKRTTYDKPVTPFLAFCMWTLPRYLDRVAPLGGRKRWRCVPKFVASQWELEMNEANEEGTVKQRSALTPVADNETGVVTVPYISMAVHGRMTTYCYSGKYHVAEQGAVDPLGDGVWTGDYVEKLNGRDDYGLMFYTLIGTDRNTGYPSFLIILERLGKKNTRVHFHRVRPNRSKNGVPVPTNQLIEECYRYMAGNVRAEEITSQQGDLIFIRADKPGKVDEEPIPVQAFESHAFIPTDPNEPCTVVRSVAKAPTNRLGWLHSKTPFKVQHPEHEDIPRLDEGWWEIRRCKSWEANPTAVWSMTID